ncbi:hypothetical protein [Roseivirga sp.]|uniref:hypothetical protein n=1 Tax=Roseivirga sp. TaxID=1964215 RepID=UPI003B8E2F28
MSETEKSISETIHELNEVFSESNKFKELEQAIKTFEKLVEKGLIKKRGNNLLSQSDLLNQNHFNYNK